MATRQTAAYFIVLIADWFCGYGYEYPKQSRKVIRIERPCACGAGMGDGREKKLGFAFVSRSVNQPGRDLIRKQLVSSAGQAQDLIIKPPAPERKARQEQRETSHLPSPHPCTAAILIDHAAVTDLRLVATRTLPV